MQEQNGRPDNGATRAPGALPTGLKWGPLGIVLFWLVLMGLLYALMTHWVRFKVMRLPNWAVCLKFAANRLSTDGLHD